MAALSSNVGESAGLLLQCSATSVLEAQERALSSALALWITVQRSVCVHVSVNVFSQHSRTSDLMLCLSDCCRALMVILLFQKSRTLYSQSVREGPPGDIQF